MYIYICVCMCIISIKLCQIVRACIKLTTIKKKINWNILELNTWFPFCSQEEMHCVNEIIIRSSVHLSLKSKTLRGVYLRSLFSRQEGERRPADSKKLLICLSIFISFSLLVLSFFIYLHLMWTYYVMCLFHYNSDSIAN